MNREDLIKEVRAVVAPLVSEMGLELVDIEYKHERGGWVLRVFIDKEGGVDLNDCVNLNQELGVLLDLKDLIEHSYNLEVSSPGLDRPLKQPEDFLRFKGKKVKVKCSEPVDNRKNFSGFIEDISGNDVILIDGEGGRQAIPLQKIRKARLVIDIN